MHYRRLLPVDQNYAGMQRVLKNIIFCEKFTPTYIMHYQMKT